MHREGFPFGIRLGDDAGVPLCSPHSAFATVHQQSTCFVHSVSIYDGKCARMFQMWWWVAFYEVLVCNALQHFRSDSLSLYVASWDA